MKSLAEMTPKEIAEWVVDGCKDGGDVSEVTIGDILPLAEAHLKGCARCGYDGIND